MLWRRGVLCIILIRFDKIIRALKLQEYFAAYLYQHRQLTLQGIGHFKLDKDLSLHEPEKDPWPENAIQFECDKLAGVDAQLIDFLSEQSGKIKPLTMADLDSYLSSGRELLNIGKPFYISGIGWLLKSQQEVYVFEQAEPVAPSQMPGAEHEYFIKDRTKDNRDGEASFDFSYPQQKKRSNKTAAFFAIVLMLSVFGLAGYFLIWPWLNKPQEQPENVAPTVEEKVESQLQEEKTEQANSNRSSVLLDTFHTKSGALKRYEQLKSYGHNVVLATADSSYFELKLILQQPIADEEKIKDSLSRLFGKPVKTP